MKWFLPPTVSQLSTSLLETNNCTIKHETSMLLHVVVRDKGRVRLTDLMNFRKSSERGGVIFNPKIYIAKFGPLNRAFSAWKWYKKVFWGMFLPYYHVEHLCYMHLMGNRIIKYTNVPPYEHTHFCHNFVAKSAM